MAIGTFLAHGAIHAGGSIFAPFSHAVSQATSNVIALELPAVETMIDLALRGWISQRTLTDFAANLGVPIDPSGNNADLVPQGQSDSRRKLWNQVYWSHQEIPAVGELGRLVNRAVLSEDQYRTALQRHGFATQESIAAVANLRYEVPGPADLVRFAVRHVFEPDLVSYLRYYEERDKGPYLLDVYHHAAGIDYPIFTGPLANVVKLVTGQDPEFFKELYTEAGLPEPTWADAYWWSHWVLPSASQGYEMLFRLRPDRDHQFDPPGTSNENFSLADLDLLLRANDYPPFYRRKLAAIAYRIPGIRFMRELIRNGVFGPAQIQDLLLRQGYSPGDANALMRSLALTDRTAARGKVEQQARGAFAKYWELGIISDQQYQDLLVEHGLQPQEAAEAVQLGRIDAAYKRAQKVVNSVHRRFINGAIDRIGAVELLSQAGIQEPVRSQMVADWQLEIVAKHKVISAEKAVKLACQGLISLDELTQRLTNLGYQADDVRVLSADAIQCVANKAAALAVKQAKAQKQQAADIIKAQKAQAQALQQLRRQLASHGSVKQLKTWLCQGLIGQAEVFQRLTFLGWPDADINRLVAENCPKQSTSGGGKGGNRGPGGPVGG